MEYLVLPITNDGESSTSFDLGSVTSPVTFILTFKYNYSMKVWVMNIANSDSVDLVTGVALVPGYDLLTRFADVKAVLGSLVVIELSPGDYQSPDKLGTDVALLWYPVGSTVAIPS